MPNFNLVILNRNNAKYSKCYRKSACEFQNTCHAVRVESLANQKLNGYHKFQLFIGKEFIVNNFIGWTVWAANRGQLVLTRTHQTRRTSTRYEILFFCFKSINLVPFDLERKRKVKMRSNIPFLLLFFSLYCYVSGWICIDKRVQKKNKRNSGRIRRVGQLKVCGFLFDSVFFCNWQNIFQEIGAEVTSFWISILGES